LRSGPVVIAANDPGGVLYGAGKLLTVEHAVQGAKKMEIVFPKGARDPDISLYA